MAQSNPILAQLRQAQQGGTDMRGAFYALCQQQGVDPQTQKIIDAIAGNRMADMQNQINQLQLQAALCGIPRTTPYGYGIVPQFAVAGCGAYNNGNI